MSLPHRPHVNAHPLASISPLARFGADCRIEAGAVIPAGCELGDDVRVGPNVVFVEPDEGSPHPVGRACAGVRIGANAVICPNVVLANGVVVRPGSVVNRSVPHGAIVEGNPATIVGYVNAVQSRSTTAPLVSGSTADAIQQTAVRGVTLHRMHVVPDLRGSLTVGEFDRQIPFTPKRYFIVFGVPSRETRGEHAHKECHQFLVCVRGSCSVVADDGLRRVEVRLESLDTGLYLPPMTWGIQYQYSSDAELLVFASHHYDADDYIRNYDDFVRVKAES